MNSRSSMEKKRILNLIFLSKNLIERIFVLKVGEALNLKGYYNVQPLYSGRSEVGEALDLKGYYN